MPSVPPSVYPVFSAQTRKPSPVSFSAQPRQVSSQPDTVIFFGKKDHRAKMAQKLAETEEKRKKAELKVQLADLLQEIKAVDGDSLRQRVKITTESAPLDSGPYAEGSLRVYRLFFRERGATITAADNSDDILLNDERLHSASLNRKFIRLAKKHEATLDRQATAHLKRFLDELYSDWDDTKIRYIAKVTEEERGKTFSLKSFSGQVTLSSSEVPYQKDSDVVLYTHPADSLKDVKIGSRWQRFRFKRLVSKLARQQAKEKAQ